MVKEVTIEQRFERHVRKTKTCWIWTGWKDHCGYGVMQFGGKKIGIQKKAHRVMYEYCHGPFDKSLYICHHCDNPSCVRPDHLFIGTQKDNMRDCASKGRIKSFNPEWLRQTKSRNFTIVSPSGETINGFNLRKFCRDNNLTYACMNDVIAGRAKSHKGYTRVKS